MSGRRRRDDGWDEGPQAASDRRDAWADSPDDRRDPWADSTVDEWGTSDSAAGEATDWAAAPAGAAANADRGRADHSRPTGPGQCWRLRERRAGRQGVHRSRLPVIPGRREGCWRRGQRHGRRLRRSWL